MTSITTSRRSQQIFNFKSLLNLGFIGIFLFGMVTITSAQDPTRERTSQPEMNEEQQTQFDDLMAQGFPFYMVEYDGSAATMDKINQALEGNGTIRHRYQTIPYVSIAVNMPNPDSWVSGYLESMDGVKSVARSGFRTVNLDQSIVQTEAMLARQGGNDGTGCGIAILDSGIDDRHCMFAGKITHGSACFSTSFDFSPDPVVAFNVCPRTSSSLTDGSLANTYEVFQFFPDHGTHVAGIAAGAPCDVTDLEAAVPTFLGGTTPGGVAPGAHIIPVNVFTNVVFFGFISQTLAFNDDLLAGLEWVYMNRASLEVCAINMSLGGGGPIAAPCADAEEMIIDMLTDEGVAVVIATGNDGFRDGVGSPACIESAIAVGAIDDAGNIAGFSNHLDAMVDLMAPGVGINSATSDFTNITRPTASFTWNLNGTSMATPHVAGAFAIIKASYPNITVDQTLESLQMTGAQVPGFTTPAIRIQAALDYVKNNIPTMGQWAMFILALLITSTGLVFIRRKMIA